jgi:hypothetical protein
MIMLHPLAARVKKPVGMFGSGLITIKPTSQRRNKENPRMINSFQGEHRRPRLKSIDASDTVPSSHTKARRASAAIR